MGGAIPGMGFFAGGLVAPFLAGWIVGSFEKLAFFQNRSLYLRIMMHIFGIAVTAALWMMLVAFDSFKPWRLDINVLSTLYLWMLGFSIVPWFVFGLIGRIAKRESGSERL